MTVPAPCPLCGSTASLDWSAAAEYHGRAWQTVTVSCDERGSTDSCEHSVSLETDGDRISGKAAQLELAVLAAWNAAALAISRRSSND